MTGEILNLFPYSIGTLKLVPSSGGRFEVLSGDTVIFSKKAIGRHAEQGEVVRLMQAKLGMQPRPREE